MFETYKKHEKQFYENVDGLRRLHDELAVQFNGKSMPKELGAELIQRYFEVFGKWQSNGEKTDVYSEQTEIVLNILELNKDHQNNPFVLTSNDLALKADQAYRNIEKIDIMLIQKFNDFARFHRRAAKLTSVIVRIFK
jgi:hypothetical protein